MNEGHGLAHHVRSHECAVGIVVFEEGNERCGDRGDLLRCHVHEFHFGRSHHGVIGVLTALYVLANERSVGTKRGITLTNDFAFFFFGAEVDDLIIVEVGFVDVVTFFVFLSAVLYQTVRRLDESEIVDLGIDTKRGDQTNVRSFRAFDRAEATVVGVVHVAHFETGAFARKTSGTEGGKTTLVRDFSQRVGLVHELRKCIRTEERVDHARDGLRVDQVGRREHFVIAHVHAFANSTAHTCQTDRELVGELFTDRAHTAIRKVVDVVDRRFRVDQFDEVFDDRDDVFAREYAHIERGIEPEFLVDAITTHFTEVVTLVGEEEVIDDFACTRIIGGLCVTQLAIDLDHRFTLGVRAVFVEGVEDDRIVGVATFLVVEENGGSAALDDLEDVVFVENSFTFEENLAAFDRGHFTCCLVDEVFRTGFGDATGQFATDGLFEVGLVDLHFFGQTEKLENILIAFVTDGTEQGGDGQLLLTIDVSVHDTIDVRGKFDPATFERNDARAVELRTVGVNTRSEEHTGRTVQLRNDHTFGTVDHKRAVVGHIRNHAQEYALLRRFKFFVIGVGAEEFQLGTQGDTVSQSALQTLIDAVTGSFDVVVEEFEHEVVACVSDGEVLRKDFEKTIVLTQLIGSVQLEKFPEGFQLHVKEVRIRHRIVYRSEIDSIVNYLGHSKIVYTN